MKNLKELWSVVLEGQEEQKNNYYATLVQIGVHGRSFINGFKKVVV